MDRLKNLQLLKRHLNHHLVFHPHGCWQLGFVRRPIIPPFSEQGHCRALEQSN